MPAYSADGNGIGNLFRSFLRIFRLLFTKVAQKNGAKALCKTALKARVQTVADIGLDRTKNAVASNVIKAGGELAQQGKAKLKEQQCNRFASGPPALPPPSSKKKIGPTQRKEKGRRKVNLGVLAS